MNAQLQINWQFQCNMRKLPFLLHFKENHNQTAIVKAKCHPSILVSQQGKRVSRPLPILRSRKTLMVLHLVKKSTRTHRHQNSKVQNYRSTDFSHQVSPTLLIQMKSRGGRNSTICVISRTRTVQLFSDRPYRSPSLAKIWRRERAHTWPGRAQPQPMTLDLQNQPGGCQDRLRASNQILKRKQSYSIGEQLLQILLHPKSIKMALIQPLSASPLSVYSN